MTEGTTDTAPSPAIPTAETSLPNESVNEEIDQKKEQQAAFSRRDTGRQRIKQGMSIYSAVDNTDGPSWLSKSSAATKYEAYAKFKPTQMSVVAPDYRKYGQGDDGYGEKRQQLNARTSKYLQNQGRMRDPLEVDDVINAYISTALPSNYFHPNEERKVYQTFKSHISNKEDRDINSIVRQHYNQRTKVSKTQGSRTKSPIYRLRTFNNVIKYMLLGNWVKPRDEHTPLTFLDLCCGKGGDLFKCEFINVNQYVGIDISDQSVHEAFHRYSQQKSRFKPAQGAPRDPRRYNFEACFATGDLFSNELPQILEPNFPGIMDKVFPVDAVSIQFSLHYSFESEDKVRTLLTNVSRSLRPGGKFLGTIPSSDFIRDKILRKDYSINDSSDRVKFGNDIYSVTFENHPPLDGVFRPPFGNRYDYYLQDAVDNVPEYIVPFETLRALCEEYGLVLKYKKNFLDMFRENIPQYFKRLNKNLIEGLQREDGKYGVEGDQKEAVAFYIAFAFEKVG